MRHRSVDEYSHRDQRVLVPAPSALAGRGPSKQLTTLADAGYVEIRKAFVGKRPRTSARLTAGGRTAFDRHVLALQQIVAGAGGSVLPSSWPSGQS
jgi:DNA-binding transcriptional LysR family regulator